MDISSAQWLSELEIEDPNIFPQCQMNFVDQSTDECNFKSFSTENYFSYPSLNFKSTPMEMPQNGIKRPAKQLKTISGNSCTTEGILTPMDFSSSSSNLIYFGNSDSPAAHSQQFYGNLNCAGKPKDETVSHGNINFSSLTSQGSYENLYDASDFGKGTKRAHPATRASSQAQDHVMSERKRRERLAQRFIALSALIPNLKKLDKASVLEDAIKYIKQLAERVKTFEEEANKTSVSVKKTWLSCDDESSSSDENSDSSLNQLIPEIEVRVLDKNVLIRIHCKKSKGFLEKIFSEIEKLRLTVMNSSVMPFGNTNLDITIITQMDVEYSMTVKDLVKSLRLACLNSM
ncbi:hypothetical protein F0562_002628 [Nyssa sinensis]|uniref:BHLH domain-containing protein n=1 Tax=Nyssa sinensis TaxID=561372 RepID=A0A5J5BU33_9ASTE|nr:hypothetical protein F0562_002628 [Nyssa sinensis]